MKRLLYYAACAQKKIVPERHAFRHLIIAVRSLRVMVTKKSNWWRLWPAMDAVSLPWEIAAG